MHRRSLLRMFLLTVITLGVYWFYWAYVTGEEMKKTDKTVRLPSYWLLFSPLIGDLAGLLLFAINAQTRTYSTPHHLLDPLGLVGVIIGIASFVALILISLYWFYRYSKAVEVVTKGSMSFDLAYVLFLVTWWLGCGWLWPLIIQNSFNKVAVGTAPGHIDG